MEVECYIEFELRKIVVLHAKPCFGKMKLFSDWMTFALCCVQFD